MRIEEFFTRRSLWVDEALVVNNVVTRNFAGLARPLSGEQGAPIGWLWAERAAVIGLGNNEYALRVVPLVSGIVALYLVFLVGRRSVGPLPAAVGTWLLALAPAAVRYSVEVKQYSSDLAICLAITVLALRAADREKQGRRLVWWGLFAAAAVWCAHPAVLVAGGTAAVLGLDGLRRRDASSVGRLIGSSVPWLASFGTVWIVSLRHLGHDPFLRAYWSAGLAPLPLRLTTFAPWVGRALLHLLVDPGYLPVALVAAACVVAGLAVIALRRPIAGALLLAPVAVAVVAATVGGFPLRGRLALWVLPVIFLSLAALATAPLPIPAGRWLGPTGAAIGLIVLVGAVIAPPLVKVLDVARDPVVWSDIRPLLQAVHRQARPGDLVWAHEPDAPPAAYYAISVGVNVTSVVHTSAPPIPCVGDTDLIAVAARHRVWFLYGYRLSSAVPGERERIVAALTAHARLVARISRPEADAWLFDFSEPGISGPPPPALPCLTLTPAAPPVPTGLTSGPAGRGSPT